MFVLFKDEQNSVSKGENELQSNHTISVMQNPENNILSHSAISYSPILCFLWGIRLCDSLEFVTSEKSGKTRPK